MSAEKWDPGTVAMVAGRDGTEVAAIWQGNQWATSTGRYLNHWQVTVRPLVVIDPDDREAVERLDDLLWASVDAETAQADMQAALREFANLTPPKPDEPLGLGAVVEDAAGTKWIRHDSVEIRTRWLNTDDCETRYRAYDDLDAVRVLSEGVS
jgi:hypothetical protein